MNKTDLIEVLAPHLGGRAAATAAVEALVDAVMRQVAAGGSVGISGFGTFEPVRRAPRTGRNPRTGEAVPIEATISPRFRPGSYFKDAVSDPSMLPAAGLAGARVGSDTSRPRSETHAGTPASVRRDASAGRSSRKRDADPDESRGTGATGRRRGGSGTVGGAPATVRADRSAEAPSVEEQRPGPAPTPVMGGGEEITQKMITAKKAQLARVKNDGVDGAKKDAATKGKGKKQKGKTKDTPKAKDGQKGKGGKKAKGKKKGKEKASSKDSKKA